MLPGHFEADAYSVLHYRLMLCNSESNQISRTNNTTTPLFLSFSCCNDKKLTNTMHRYENVSLLLGFTAASGSLGQNEIENRKWVNDKQTRMVSILDGKSDHLELQD